MKWQDVFELIETGHGAACLIGGDPEMYARGYIKGYKIRNKTTGEVSSLVPMSKYTGEHYASEMFKELHNDVERFLLHN
jgi:hypothetical protein